LFFCYEYVLFECVVDRTEQTLLTDILLSRSCKAVVSYSMEHIWHQFISVLVKTYSELLKLSYDLL